MNQRVKYPTTDMMLPPGRLVRGSLTEKTVTDHKNVPLPENKHHYWIAIAIPKGPAVDAIWQKIWTHVYQTYSNVAGSAPVLQQIQMGLSAPSFAWKLDDGDTDPKWSQREGCKGCLVFQMSTTFDIATFDNSNAQLDPRVFKLGDYVDVYVSIAINGEVGNTAGIFINPRGVRWLQEGERITVGPDAATMFGAPVGKGYTGHSIHAPAPSGQVTGAQPASGSVYQHYAVNPLTGQPTPAPAPAVVAPVETAQQQAARLGAQYYPGFRINETTRTYEPEQPAPTPTAPVQPSVPGFSAPAGAAAASAYGGPMPGHAGPPPSVPAAAPVGAGMIPPPGGHAAAAYAPASPPTHASAPVAAAGAGAYPAPSAGVGTPGATAYPSSFGPDNPPPVAPMAGFVSGGR